MTEVKTCPCNIREKITEILATVARFHPKADLTLVREAFEFADAAHEGQIRKSGEPYIIHPIEVAKTLADMKMDVSTVAAGFLHDCVEDNENISLDIIRNKFGDEVAMLVDGVTKLKRINFHSKEEQQAESMRKMCLSMISDLRVLYIKLADRLHNMRTLKYQKPERQVPIAQETLQIYAAFSHRLGLSSITWELEDLAFRYIDPENYYKLAKLVDNKLAERRAIIEQIERILQMKLQAEGIEGSVSGRPKHLYSIFRKMQSQDKNFEQILDLFAVRVLVNTVADCYSVLGIVSGLWTPLHNRYKDYIARPKSNNYRSLHNTYIATAGELRGQTFEVQIRTHEMHKEAEYGVAAHWQYKEGKRVDNHDADLNWVREIQEGAAEISDPDEFMNALKTDLTSDEVFVFTPKGDIISLPRGATPIDFAYRIHSAVGNRCMGAKIDGRMVSLDTPLETGNFVDIQTSPNKTPSRDWLKMCKTSRARNKILAYFKTVSRDENIEKGRDMLEDTARRKHYLFSSLNCPEYLESTYKKYSISSLDALYLLVGRGEVSEAAVINALIEAYRKAQQLDEPIPEVKPTATKKSETHAYNIVVEGLENVEIRLAKCCTPVPGDDIVGYVTRGRGVSTHRRNCTNLSQLMQDPGRIRPAHWIMAEEAEGYEVSVRLLCNDRVGMLADVSQRLTDMNISITYVGARADKAPLKKKTTIDLTFNVHSTNHLKVILENLRNLKDVLQVFRTSN